MAEDYIDRDLYDRGADIIFGKGAQEAGSREALMRLKAVRDAKANIQPSEYIEYDLYGRGDTRIFGKDAHIATYENAKDRLAEQEDPRRFSASRALEILRGPYETLRGMYRSVKKCVVPSVNEEQEQTAANNARVVEISPPTAIIPYVADRGIADKIGPVAASIADTEDEKNYNVSELDITVDSSGGRQAFLTAADSNDAPRCITPTQWEAAAADKSSADGVSDLSAVAVGGMIKHFEGSAGSSSTSNSKEEHSLSRTAAHQVVADSSTSDGSSQYSSSSEGEVVAIGTGNSSTSKNSQSFTASSSYSSGHLNSKRSTSAELARDHSVGTLPALFGGTSNEEKYEVAEVEDRARIRDTDPTPPASSSSNMQARAEETRAVPADHHSSTEIEAEHVNDEIFALSSSGTSGTVTGLTSIKHETLTTRGSMPDRTEPRPGRARGSVISERASSTVHSLARIFSASDRGSGAGPAETPRDATDQPQDAERVTTEPELQVSFVSGPHRTDSSVRSLVRLFSGKSLARRAESTAPAPVEHINSSSFATADGSSVKPVSSSARTFVEVPEADSGTGSSSKKVVQEGTRVRSENTSSASGLAASRGLGYISASSSELGLKTRSSKTLSLQAAKEDESRNSKKTGLLDEGSSRSEGGDPETGVRANDKANRKTPDSTTTTVPQEGDEAPGPTAKANSLNASSKSGAARETSKASTSKPSWKSLISRKSSSKAADGSKPKLISRFPLNIAKAFSRTKSNKAASALARISKDDENGTSSQLPPIDGALPKRGRINEVRSRKGGLVESKMFTPLEVSNIAVGDRADPMSILREISTAYSNSKSATPRYPFFPRDSSSVSSRRAPMRYRSDTASDSEGDNDQHSQPEPEPQQAVKQQVYSSSDSEADGDQHPQPDPKPESAVKKQAGTKGVPLATYVHSPWKEAGLERKEEIGRGTFGSVHRAVEVRTGASVAVKKVEKKPWRQDRQYREHEIINILGRHPNIIEGRGAFDDKNNTYVVVEYVPNGDLQSHRLSVGGQVKETSAARFIAATATALQHCHKTGVIHRDIKPENLLMDGAGSVKLCHFGAAAHIERFPPRDTMCGSPAFLSPEVCQELPYDASTDLWSLGTVLFELLYGELPFRETGRSRFERARGKLEPLKFPETPRVSHSAKDLMQKLLTADPEKRISASEVLKHPWIVTHTVEMTTPPIGRNHTLPKGVASNIESLYPKRFTPGAGPSSNPNPTNS